MTLSGRWRFQPFYDVADASGVGAPAAEPSVPESDSLADHEASYAPGTVEPETDGDLDPVAAKDRDDTGKFKPRHKAKSQIATPEDVPRIQELTRRLRETERERDELRTRTQPREEPRRADPARAAQPTDTFPTWEQWQEKNPNIVQEHGDAAWYLYDDARKDWHYDRRRAAERAADAVEADAKTYRDEVAKYAADIPAVVKDFPDFEDVTAGISVSLVVERAVTQVGPRAAYWLATHAEERDALSDDTMVNPKDPAFKAAVAATRRYLQSLVASEQRSSSQSPSRTAAGSTGAALALAPQPTPKPPTPVRTSVLREAEAPPGDDSSLADHERAFAPKRRRA